MKMNKIIVKDNLEKIVAIKFNKKRQINKIRKKESVIIKNFIKIFIKKPKYCNKYLFP